MKESKTVVNLTSFCLYRAVSEVNMPDCLIWGCHSSAAGNIIATVSMWVFSGFSSFLPPTKNSRWISYAIFPLGANECA